MLLPMLLHSCCRPSACTDTGEAWAQGLHCKALAAVDMGAHLQLCLTAYLGQLINDSIIQILPRESSPHQLKAQHADLMLMLRKTARNLKLS